VRFTGDAGAGDFAGGAFTTDVDFFGDVASPVFVVVVVGFGDLADIESEKCNTQRQGLEP